MTYDDAPVAASSAPSGSDVVDRQARSIASSPCDEESKRSRLLGLALSDPVVLGHVRRADPSDAERAVETMAHKVLAAPATLDPLDLSRIAAGDSFSGWVHKTFRLMIADSRRKRMMRSACRGEISLDSLLSGAVDGHDVGEQRLGLSTRDRPNPYRTIVMRRPMGGLYRDAEEKIRLSSPVNPTGALDAALDSLESASWVLADDTDRVDDRLILSLLMPRLRSDERAALDDAIPGLGAKIAYGDRGNGLGGLWSILDRTARRESVTSMVVWERVTHRLFDMRWASSSPCP